MERETLEATDFSNGATKKTETNEEVRPTTPARGDHISGIGLIIVISVIRCREGARTRRYR